MWLLLLIVTESESERERESDRGADADKTKGLSKRDRVQKRVVKGEREWLGS